jgi:hypothetical protein
LVVSEIVQYSHGYETIRILLYPANAIVASFALIFRIAINTECQLYSSIRRLLVLYFDSPSAQNSPMELEEALFVILGLWSEGIAHKVVNLRRGKDGIHDFPYNIRVRGRFIST